jgi:hypothetical protein
MKRTVFLLLVLAFPVQGQVSGPDSIWLPLSPLIGSWEGKGGGQPGTGEYTRSCAFIFDGKFIEVRNRSVYPPTEKQPGGEVHEDVGYISYDRRLGKFILRQFHKEGFVNQYALDSLSSDGRRAVFQSTAIENIPPDWRARESYDLTSRDEFSETFELAGPGEPFEVYTRVTFRRAR